MNPVVHFEMPYEDRERMVEFYEKVFGWKLNMLGPEMGDYVIAMTGEMDEKDQLPKNPGMINGGFFKKSQGNQHPSVVILTNNIRESMRKVEEAGGKIVGGQGSKGEPDDIPGVGLYVSFIDTEGNRVSIMEQKPMDGK